MEQIISKLKEIKKDELTEREFYFQVLTVLDGLNNVKLTEENHVALKQALLEIGCKDTKTWKKEKREKGEVVEPYPTAHKAVLRADMLEGVNMVSQFLYDYEHAICAKNVISPGTIYSWPQEWCKRSKIYY